MCNKIKAAFNIDFKNKNNQKYNFKVLKLIFEFLLNLYKNIAHISMIDPTYT